MKKAAEAFRAGQGIIAAISAQRVGECRLLSAAVLLIATSHVETSLGSKWVPTLRRIASVSSPSDAAFPVVLAMDEDGAEHLFTVENNRDDLHDRAVRFCALRLDQGVHDCVRALIGAVSPGAATEPLLKSDGRPLVEEIERLCRRLETLQWRPDTHECWNWLAAATQPVRASAQHTCHRQSLRAAHALPRLHVRHTFDAPLREIHKSEFECSPLPVRHCTMRHVCLAADTLEVYSHSPPRDTTDSDIGGWLEEAQLASVRVIAEPPRGLVQTMPGRSLVYGMC